MRVNAELTRLERVILDEILDEREPSHWTPHRVRLAIILARELTRLLQIQEALQQQGSTIRSPSGNATLNPLVRVADRSIKTICAYRRTLSIHARGLGGEARDIARRRAIRLEQQKDANCIGDDLIAKPGAR